MRPLKALSLLFLSLNLALADENATNKLEVVVISATGFEQDADENLRNVIVIYGRDLQSRGYTNLQEALSRIAGVGFVDSGAGNVVDLRGQGAKANVSTKVMIDGKSINLLDATVAVTPINAVNIDEIERIEIIPGGGAVLYGNGTRGGAINIITKKSKDTKASLSLLSQGYDEDIGANANLSFTAKIHKNIAYNFNFNTFNDKLYRYNSKQNGSYINQKLLIDIDEKQSLNLSYNYYTNTITSASFLTKAQIEDNPRQSDNPTRAKITRPSFDINHHFSLGSVEFDTLAFRQRQVLDYLDGSTGGSQFTDTLSGLKVKGKYNYLEYSYLILGYDLALHKNTRDLKTRQTLPIMSIDVRTMADMKKDSHSAFALNSFAFNEKFNLALGGRYEYASYKSKRGTQTTRVQGGVATTTNDDYAIPTHNDGNFAFEVTPSFTYSQFGKIYAKYERGFISPNPSQLTNKIQIATQPTAQYEYRFADLKSEIFDTLEVGMSDYWWEFYGVKLSAFYTKTKGEITQFGPGYTQWWENRNIDETTRFGTELQMSQDFEVISLNQSLAYIDATISKGVNKGKILPYVSKFRANASVNYRFYQGFLAFVDVNYYSRAKDAGRIIDNTTGEMADNAWKKQYLITDIGINYNYKAMSVMAGVKNIFGAKYYSYQNAYNDSYLPGDGRSYYLGLGYKF